MKEDSLSNKVYTELRRKILSHQFTPGTRLKEDAWAKKLEVSRIALREALNRLLGEQLLEVGPKGGYYIKSMKAEDIREIRELREVLELGALRLAFQKAGRPQVEELEKICEDFSSMVSSGYFGGACEADMKFHETLITIAGNERLKNIYLSSNIPLFHLRLGQAQTHMNDYELTDVEHRTIVSALKDNNLRLAEETLTRHLLRGESASLDLD